MRHTLTTALLFLMAGSAGAKAANKDQLTFTSPDGRLNININAQDGQLRYSVYEGQLEDNNIYALSNNIALQMEGMEAGRYSFGKPIKVSEHFDAPNYKITSFDDVYNKVVVRNKNGVNVEFRAYNSGVAYRFFTTTSSSKEWVVTNEVAEFNFGDDHTAYLPYSTNPRNPKAMAFQATYSVAPLSQTKDLDAFLPTTVDCGKAKVTIMETDVEDYPGMFLLPDGDKANGAVGVGKPVQGLKADFAKYPKSFDFYPGRKQKYVTGTEAYIAKGQGKRTFPWRILAITHDDKEMPVNTLAYQLASPSRISGDTSWIKPGKVAWDWWNNWGISGVDFKAGINQQTYKHYIDFAASHNLEYIILDEGWYKPQNGDMLTVIPDLNLPELVDYAKQRNVGIVLWTVFNVLDDQLNEACEKYAAMGIKGFKVDFLDRNDQEGMEMIYRIAKRCAESKLILDYHGIFAPQGINRTYPNVINFEAVFGMEEVKWTSRTTNMPLYDVTFPFIRGMTGYVDFTPGGMRNATKADFQPIYYNPLTMGTRCHQLAHYIVHDSPFTMLADNPTAYEKEPESTAFIASLPTVFDNMQILDGKLGEYIITARRQGDNWYVAGETNWDAREVELNSAFLPSGTYEITAFIDGPNADQTATDYVKQTFDITVSQSETKSVKIYMAGGGGFAARIVRK